MKLAKTSIIGLVSSLLVFAVTLGMSSAASSEGCQLVVTAPISFVNNKNNTQTAWFVVTNPNDCASGTTIDVTLAVWKTCQYNGIPLSSQTLYSHTTAAVKVGVFDTVTAKLPTNSYYQTDLLLGSSATDNGTPNYTTVTRLGTDIGGVACSTPKPTPTPTPTPTTTTTPTTTNNTGGSATVSNNNTNTNINNNVNNLSSNSISNATATATVNGSDVPASSSSTTTTSTSTPAASTSSDDTETSSTPSQLVNTGPGNVVAIFGAVTTGGALLHRFFLRKLFY